jgi:hypothetical protein
MSESEIAMRCVWRAPNLILRLIKEAKEAGGFMEAENAFEIFNTYGILPKHIFLLLYTHGIFFPMETLLILIKHQQEKSSKNVLCGVSEPPK